MQAAQRHTRELVLEQLGVSEAEFGRLGLQFNRLPREALQDLVGFTQAGSPLRDLLDKLGAAASEQVQRELVTGLGLGLGPREIAARCRKALGGNLTRALTIARTETMRAYREASGRQMEADADLLEGWVWMSGNDGRTCAACLAMHGTVHPVGARLDDHPNGRCSQVPRTQSWAALGKKYGIDLSDVPDSRVQVTPGTELFERMSPERQMAILGPGKFAAWQRGEFDLQDVAGQAQSSVWGSHRHVRSLDDTLGAASRRSRPGTFRSLGSAERWATQRAFAHVDGVGGGPWGIPFSTDAERLNHLNKVLREELAMQRQFPAMARRRAGGTFHNTLDNRGTATLGSDGGIAVSRDLTLAEARGIDSRQASQGYADSVQRTDHWVPDNYRHERGHTLMTPQVEKQWEVLYRKYKDQQPGWWRTAVSDYAEVGNGPGTEAVEAFAECFSFMTRWGYKRGAGTLPSDVESFIDGFLW